MTLPVIKTPQVVKWNIGQGDSNLQDLAPVLYSIINDLTNLRTAILSHTHQENTAATYTQNAQTAATTYVVAALNTQKQSY